MKKSKFTILLLFLVMILAISAASAADLDDNSDSAVQAVDEAAVDEVASADVDDVISTDNTANVLADVGDKNFTVLKEDINTAPNGVLEVKSNYVRADGEDDIVISKDIIMIGDDTHKIDANKLGAIFKVNEGCKLILQDVILVNGNNNYGGAIYNEGTVSLASSHISNSNASVGGAIYNKGIVLISGSTLDENSATTLGGAIYSEGKLTVGESNFINNKVTTASAYNPGVNSNGGAGIFSTEGSNLTVTGSIFTGNEAIHPGFGYFTSGGAIYVYRAVNTLIDDCTFNDNVAGLGGAIIFEGFSQDGIALSNSRFTNNSAWQGGAVNVNEFVGNLVMTGNTFTENKAVGPNLGGSSPDSNPASAGAISVGTMSTTGTTVEISDSDFIGNTAVNGGAVVVNENTEVAIQNCDFIANVVSNSASAISSSGKVNINESRFKQNKGSLGTLYLSQSEYSVTNCNFTENDDPWGDILNYGGTLTLKNNNIDTSVGITSWGPASSVVTDYKITILNNGSYEINQETYNVSAVITDDNNNIIRDYVGGHFQFVIDGKKTTATYKDGEYKATCIIPTGIYIINITCSEENNLTIETATIKNYRGTFKDLQNKTTNAQNNKLELEYDFAYTPELGDDAYVNGVEINSALTIDGNGYTISGGNVAKIFNVTSGTLTLNNMTVANGVSTEPVDSNKYGGAIHVSSGAALVAENVTFINNTAAGQGGAIFSWGDVTIKEGTKFINNTAETGGAIFVIQANALEITGATFADNTATSIAGAVYANANTVTITDSSFNNNTAEKDSGAVKLVNTQATITSSNFTANKANTLQGGAVYVGQTSSLTVDDCKFENNTALNVDNGDGAAIYSGFAGPLVVKDSEFVNNTAGATGGAISSQFTATEITGSKFEDNKAATAGALYILDYSGLGGATSVKDSEFISNEATGNGGAIFFYDEDNNGLTIDNTNFTDNKAGNNGGAILLAIGNADITANFTGNDATVNGSAVYNRADGNADIKDSTFTKNGEATDYAVYNLGKLTLTGNSIDNLVYNTGAITTKITVKILNGDTPVVYANNEIVINATIIADNTLIDDDTFKFVITKGGVLINDSVDAVYDPVNGDYKGTYTLPSIGNYTVSIASSKNTDLDITVGYIYNIKGTFTALNASIAGASEVNLNGNFTYDALTDGAAFINGIVIDHDVIINGNGYTISGNNIAQIFKVTSGTLTLNNVTVCKGNSTEALDGNKFGGAVHVASGASLVAENVAFINNTAASQGGAIFAFGNVTIKEGTTFINNHAVSGGAIYTYGDLDITGAIFTENTAKDVSGAILAAGDKLTIKESSFNENIAGLDTGAIRISGIKEATISSTNFTGNKANTLQGGAIYVSGSNLTVNNNCKFVNNSAEDVNNGDGGAIYVSSRSSLAVSDSEFINNTANVGGAIYNVVSSTEITGSVFKENKAATAGAVYVLNMAGLGNATTIKGSEFISNEATGNGGAIFFYDENGDALTISDDTNFTDNKAGNTGGAILLAIGNATITGANFTGNNATNNGSAVYIRAAANTDIKDSTFTKNGEKTDYAVYNLGKLSLSGNTMDNNLIYSEGAYSATITATVLGNGTYDAIYTYDLNATLTDDQGNNIYDPTLRFIVNGVELNTVPGFNSTTGVYNITGYVLGFEPTYLVGVNVSGEATVKYGIIKNLKYGTFTDLQAKINASIAAGEELNLTYNFTFTNGIDDAYINGIVINGDLTINGNGTTINGNNTAKIFKVTSGTLTLNNVTVSNGKTIDKYDGINEHGGAVYVAAGAGLVAENVTFINNAAYDKGGAIYALGDVTIKAGTTFTNNTASTAGAIYAQTGTTLDITGATFTENNATNYGAVYSNGILNIKDSIFNENSATGEAGAIRFTGTVATITSTNFTGNKAGSNGGAISGWGDLTVDGNSKFENNTANKGGAIYADFNTKGLTVKDTQFINNNATADGGAIFFTAYKLLNVSGSEFTDNNAGSNGGAIFGGYDTVEITDSSFNSNEAKTGAAIYVSGNINVKESEFVENEATGNGGAIFYYAQTATNKLAVSDKTNFTNNKANNGEAVYIYSGNADITDANFTKNGETTDYAIYNKGTLELTNTKVDNLVYSNGTFNTQLNATFLNNATWYDGVLYGTYTLNATLTDKNGNKIYDPNFRFAVDGVNITDIPKYDETTGLYTVGYNITSAGLKVVSTNYETVGLVKHNGAIDVDKANVTEFTVTVADTIEKGNTTVFITLLGVNGEKLNATVTVYVNNTPTPIIVTNGTGNKTIEGLDHGSYAVVAMLPESANYKEAINSTVFYVKGISILTIEEIGEVVYGDPIIVRVNLTDKDGNGLTGTVVVSGENVLINNGTGFYEIAADVGTYDVIAEYAGNNDYNASVSKVSFTVKPKNITGNVTVYVYPNAGTAPDNVTVYIYAPYEGIYNVTVDGQTVQVDVRYNATYDNIYGTVAFSGLTIGNNTATVIIDDNNYVMNPVTENFTYKYDPDFNVTFNGTYPNLEITIEGTDGDYIVDINGKYEVNVTVVGGKGNKTVPGIAAGTYDYIDVTFKETDEYNYGYYEKLNVVVAKAQTVIEVVATQVAYPNAVVVNVTSNAAGNYTVKVGDESKEVPLKAGEVKEVIFEGLAANENGYAINVTYAETENYTAGVNDTETVKVLKGTVVFNATVATPVVYPNNVTVTVNSTVAGKVTIDGKYVYDIGVGVTELPISGLIVDTYTEMEVLFEADNYNSVTKNITFEVVQGTPNISVEVSVVVDTYPGAVTVFVTSDVDGNYNITVGDETKPVTVANGIGKESFSNVDAGIQNATVTFLGDANYNVTTAEKEFTINKANATGICEVKVTRYPDDVVITIEGTDGVYNASVDAEHFVEITVVGGKGTGNISGLAAGVYNLTVNYIENKNYNPKEFKFEFVVYKHESYVEIDPVTETVTYPGAVNITFTALHGVPVFNITDASGKEVSFTTVDNKIVLAGLAAGTYTVKALIKETQNYTADYDEITFDVEKAVVVIEPKATGEFIVDGKVNVTFKLPTDVTGTITVKVDNVDQVIPTPVEGVYTFEFNAFKAGSHTFVVSLTGDANYTDAMGQTSFDVAKIDPTISIAPDNSVPNPENILIKVADDATGSIFVEIPGYLALKQYDLDNGAYTLQLGPIPADDYKIFVTYMGDAKYNNGSANTTFTIVKLTAPEVIVNITDAAIVGQKDVVVNITVGDNFAYPGNVTVYVDGNANQTVAIDEYGNVIVTIPALENGTHIIGVKYNGNAYFNASDIVNKTLTVTKAPSSVTITPIGNVTYGSTIKISYTIVNETDHVTILVTDEAGTTYEKTIEDGVITIDYVIPAGKYTVSIYNGENGFYKASEANITFNVTKGPEIDINVAENTTTPTFTITLPEDAKGNLLVDIDGNHYYAPVVNGTATVTVPPLAAGNYTANITYTGDGKYPEISNTTNVSVPSNLPDDAISIPTTATTLNPTFGVNLPSDAGGYIEVDVDGKKYYAVVENGKASVSVPGLSTGEHNVTVTYSGDGKYTKISKSATVTLTEPVPGLKDNKNINVIYSGSATYKVLVTLDGKAASGETVTIKYNGKTYTVKSDSNGYATLKLNTKVKVKTYTITATYKGVTVTNKVKVKHILNVKNKVVKKSKKVTKVKITLKKLTTAKKTTTTKKTTTKKSSKSKAKYVKVKFRGKTYKVKVKKNVATWKVKKSMVKKLKVGKKYKYKVTYGKDVVTKKLTIKR